MARVTNSLPCPLCGSPTVVPETRGEANVIRRKRRCTNDACGHKFITREVFERDVRPMPAKRNKTSWTKESHPHV